MNKGRSKTNIGRSKTNMGRSETQQELTSSWFLSKRYLTSCGAEYNFGLTNWLHFCSTSCRSEYDLEFTRGSFLLYLMQIRIQLGYNARRQTCSQPGLCESDRSLWPQAMDDAQRPSTGRSIEALIFMNFATKSYLKTSNPALIFFW